MTNWLLIISIIVLLIALSILIYETISFLGFRVFVKRLKRGKFEKPHGNLYYLIFKKVIKKLSKKSGVAGGTVNSKPGKLAAAKKFLRTIRKIHIVTILFQALVVMACVIIIALNIVVTYPKNTASTVLELYSEECTCYAECTDNPDDDKYSVYQLIFGEAEYNKFVGHLNLTTSEDIDSWNIISEGEDGRAKSEFLKSHLTEDMVNDYKALVTDAFRHSDHKHRSTMSTEELKVDLELLLSDYKIGGRNPNCKCCKNATKDMLSIKCIGVKHYVEGWSWEALWGQDDGEGGYTDPKNGDYVANGYFPGRASGDYTIELDDGTYYWFKQTTSSVNGFINPFDPLCRDGSIVDGKPMSSIETGFGSGTLGGRGCFMYSTAMSLSNLIGRPVTFFEIINKIGGTVSNDKSVMTGTSGVYKCVGSEWASYWNPVGQSGTGINYAVGEVTINYSTAADTLSKAFESEGVHVVKIGWTQEEVDKYLTDPSIVAYVVSSFDKNSFIYRTNGHFITLRRKDSDGNYSCFNSVQYGELGDADGGADKSGYKFGTMNIRAPWSGFSGSHRNEGAIVFYKHVEDYTYQASSGVSGAPSGEWYTAVKSSDIKKGNLTGIKIYDTMPTYDGLPWDWENGVYFFNAAKAADDVLQKVNSTDSCGTTHALESEWGVTYGKPDGSSNKYYDRTKNGDFRKYAGNTAEYTAEDGITRLKVAILPSVADPSFCNNFTGTAWKTDGVPAVKTTKYDYIKFCGVWKNKQTGKIEYIPMIAADSKDHTFPGGACQTNLSLRAPQSGETPPIVSPGDWGGSGFSGSRHHVDENVIGDYFHKLYYKDRTNDPGENTLKYLLNHAKCALEVYGSDGSYYQNGGKGYPKIANLYEPLGFLVWPCEEAGVSLNVTTHSSLSVTDTSFSVVDSSSSGSSSSFGGSNSAGDYPEGNIYLDNTSKFYPYLFSDGGSVPPMYCTKFVSNAANKKGKTVYIDPGHGLNSTGEFTRNLEHVLPLPNGHKAYGSGDILGAGYQGRGTGEDEFTLEVGLKLKDKLLADGYDVVMSRTTQDRPNTNGGSGILATMTSDICISIHWNAGDKSKQGQAKGIEAYYVSNACTSTGGYDYSSIVQDTGKTQAWSDNSKRLAELCCQYVTESSGIGKHRGAIPESERILEYSSIPATLVECGFADNKSDRAILDSKREEIADGFKKAIDAYFGF